MSAPLTAMQLLVRADDARQDAGAVSDPQAKRMMLAMAAGNESAGGTRDGPGAIGSAARGRTRGRLRVTASAEVAVKAGPGDVTTTAAPNDVGRDEALDISPRDVPLDDDDWVPTEPEFESDVGDELTDIAPLVTAKARAGRSSGQSARNPPRGVEG